MANIDWQNDSDKEIENKMKDTVFNLDMLMNAAYYGRVEIIRFMKKENYIDRETINQVDTSSGYCPLYNAILSGSAEAVELLIKLGADANKFGEHQHVTSLHLAASLGHTPIVKSLVHAHRVNVNITANNKLTPLHLAAYTGQMETVEALIELGADVNAEDENKKTPLHLAKQASFPEIVKVLIKNGAGRKKGKTKVSPNKKKLIKNKKFEENYLNFWTAIKTKAKGIL